jgi:hypothetical protein
MLDDLAQALVEKRAILFVGSGLSAELARIIHGAA